MASTLQHPPVFQGFMEKKKKKALQGYAKR